ncbi:hypothetical protein JCM16358_01790 [Halanaerocella petrolearia]
MSGPTTEETKEVTINLIESIIDQYKALAHLLNTEVAKLKEVSRLSLSLDQIIIFHQELVSIIKSITQIHLILHFKLESILKEQKIDLIELDALEVIIFLEVVIDNFLQVETQFIEQVKKNYKLSRRKLLSLERSLKLIIKSGERMKESLQAEIDELELYL